MNRFAGRIAIITGGGGGIGAATARRFSEEGAAVIVADVDEDAVSAVAAAVRKNNPRSLHIVADVSDEDAVRNLMSLAVEKFGRLDILVNSAGISGPLAGIDEFGAADWDRVIGVNLTGVFYGIKHAARIMKRQRSGIIVNVSSVLGIVGGGSLAYSVSKHGVIGLTKTAAIQLAPSGIRVVAVAPAFVRTSFIEGIEKVVLPRHPIGRLGTPEEVAGMVAYLASDEAAFLTGATYLVDGGYTAGEGVPF